MGQRLVVELFDNGDILGSIYFHWSAYFAPTIQELKYISDDILDAENKDEDVLLGIISGLEKRGGGLRNTFEDIIKADGMFPGYKFKDPDTSNRNDGVITFTQEGIEDYRKSADGFANIDISTKKIVNMVWEEADPFQFTKVEKDGKITPQYVIYRNVVCPVEPADMNCESIQRLYEFMEKRFEDE